MKKSIFSIMAAAALLSSLPMSAQLDRSKAPLPGPAPKIEFGSYEKFTMKNGLRVIVVEDHDRPLVTANITFLYDSFPEGDIAGVSDVFSGLWDKGTVSRTAEEISEQVEFMGANLVTRNSGIAFMSLSKYLDEMMEITSDVLLHPTFPQDEMDKQKKQIYGGLETSKTDASSILDNISTATVYPAGHPYSDIMTEETVAAVTVQDCRDFYERVALPNDAIMVFVGDITLKQAKSVTKKYLKNWKPGEPREVKAGPVPRPQGIQVVFSPKDGAVQSSIQLMSPVELKPGAPDILAAQMANFIYGGGGFTAKLMKNLREDKGYTYGAYSSLSSDEISGSFTAAGEVNAEATDKSFIEMRRELQAMRDGDYEDIDLERAKKAYAGSFSRSLEEATTLASFALNIEHYGLPEDYYATYLQRLDAVTRDDVQAAVRKYMDPDNAYYFVVGDENVLGGMEKLDSDGKVVVLDYKGDPIVRKQVSPEMTVRSVYDRYIEFVGGRALMEGVEDISETMTMDLMGMQMVTETVRIPGRQAMSLKQMMGGNQMQGMVLRDGKLTVTAQGQTQEITDPAQISSMTEQLTIFPELGSVENASLAGMEEVDGHEAYKVKMELPMGVAYNFYDVKTGSKLKSVAVVQGQTQEVIFSDYRKTGYGIMYPMLQKTKLPQVGEVDVKVTDLKINQGLTPAQL